MTTITQTITPLPTAPDPATMTPAVFSATAAAFVLAQKSESVELETFRGQVNTVAGEVNTNATTATTQATLSSDWATKTTGVVAVSEYSSKSYAIGGTGVTSALGAAKEWAITVGSAVITGTYSAKEHAIGDLTATGGSAKAWAVDVSSPDGTALKSAKTSAAESAVSAAAALVSENAASASAASAAAIAGAFVGTSTTNWTPTVGAQAFSTQTGEQYTAGTFLSVVSNGTPTAWGVGQVTTYTGSTLTINIQVVNGSGAHTDWNISLTGTRGATGATGPGITPQAVGFTLTGGTVSKTLTVSNTLTLAGTDGTTMTFPSTSTTIARSDAGNTWAGNQIFSDAQIIRAMLIDVGYTFLDKGNSSTTTQTFDYTTGSHQKVTATGNHTIAISNWPPTGNLGELLVEYVNAGAYTLTWPTINWIKPNGTLTTSFSTYLAVNLGRTALQTSGTDFIIFWTRDAGTTIYGKLI